MISPSIILAHFTDPRSESKRGPALFSITFQDINVIFEYFFRSILQFCYFFEDLQIISPDPKTLFANFHWCRTKFYKFCKFFSNLDSFCDIFSHMTYLNSIFAKFPISKAVFFFLIFITNCPANQTGNFLNQKNDLKNFLQ